MDMIIQLLHKTFLTFGPFFILLGLLIFVHELGHFLVAIYFGVRVETFSMGFGPKIFKHKRGDTTYCLSIIPLGGYVKMYGDDPTAEIPADQKRYSFLHQPVWPRIAIVLAGPLMNLFFAGLIFMAVVSLGEDVQGPQVGDIAPSTPAYAAGFRSGDTITKVNGTAVDQWKEIKEIIEENADQKVQFTVRHENSKDDVEFTATPALRKNDFLFSMDRQVGKIEGLSLESLAPLIGITDPKGLAATAGLHSLDVIESVDGKPVAYWRELENIFNSTALPHEWVLSVRALPEKEDAKEAPAHEVRLKSPDGLTAQDGSVLAALGVARSDLFLANVNAGTPAALAGLKRGDQVTKINGTALTSWQDVLSSVKSFQPDQQKSLAFTVIQNGEQKDISITPRVTELPNDQGATEKRYAIGVMPAIMLGPNSIHLLKYTNPIKIFTYAASQSYETSKFILISFLRLIDGEVSARNIGGIITIGRVASKSFEVGIVAFLKMMALISINLFLLNLFPIPVLDGGHLLFFSVEAIKGSPISQRVMEVMQQAGLVFLLSLMIFALYNDFSHLISSW
jgi:regulator of sigma E protease